MSWGEFCILLAGLNGDTPLGQIVSIRMEEDKEKLDLFTREQHAIRNKWRERLSNINKKEIDSMTEEEKQEQVKKIHELIKEAFGE